MAMPLKIVGAILVVSAGALLSLSAPKTAAQERCHPALQDNKKIIAPDADVPPSIRRWSGLYGGMWDDTLCASLAILQVNRDGTIFFQYAWDVAPQWGITVPGSYVDQARITGDTLSFITNYGQARATYVYGSGGLSGTYAMGDHTYRATFKKQP